MAAKTKANEQAIVVTILDQDYTFRVSRQDYNKYINTMLPNNKVAPSHNLVVNTVIDENRDAVITILEENPGAEMEIATSIVTEYSPDLGIVAKKLKK
ncbi:hypothetical protein HBA55_34650 [Pseudomaricurvus alkylphenolicus]|uniref:putative phage tail assembly chaperone n=1 Tax=Pseudomaricurvus alkylphenolicus TaxID=1306991 RepID=UPI001422B772|nr:putative phage tail assembly chaperone [Pseudomaricurvus alkylphenolicus]NIB44772.1 hypothetical protein [Pseudomaricurvus alkylphenolicus]